MADHEKIQKAGRNGRQGGRVTKRKGRRIWIIALLFIIVVTAFVLSGWMRTSSSADTGFSGGTFTVRQDDLIITVTESGKPVSRAQGVRFIELRDGSARLEVESGTYRFESSLAGPLNG